MRLLRLHLQNTGTHEDLDLDLSGLTAAAIVGLNGAGKSTIPEALYWNLYGIVDGSVDALIRDGANRMCVVFEVELGGSRWRVTRSRERGRSADLLLERQDGGHWTSLTQRTIAETQARVMTHLTGMGASAFVATAYSRQGECGQMAKMGSAARKDLFGSLIDLDGWEPWREQASALRRVELAVLTAHDTRAEEMLSQIGTLSETLDDADALHAAHETAERAVHDAQAAVEAAQAAQEAVSRIELRRSLEQQIVALQQRQASAVQTAARRDALVVALADADNERARLGDLEKHRRAYEATLAAHHEIEAAAHRELDAARGRVTKAQEALTAATTRRDSMHVALATTACEHDTVEGTPGATCPTCDQELPDTSKVVVLTRLGGRVTELTVAVATAGADVSDAEADLAGAVAARDSVSVPAPPATNGYDAAAWHAASVAVTRLDRLAGEQEALNAVELDDPAAMDVTISELRVQANALPTDAAHTIDVPAARQQLADAHTALRDADAAIAEAAAQHAHYEQLCTDAEAHDQHRAVIAARAAALDVATRAFSRSGVPALILDTAVGAVEDHANDVLAHFDTTLRVRLETQRATKAGGFSETLDIMVNDGEVERPIGRYGGGEAYRVHLALRSGLARALAGADGPLSNLLLLDEVTDLDSKGIERLAQVLAAWPGQVLIVTHDERLSRALPARIRVTRDRVGDASTVQIVA